MKNWGVFHVLIHLIDRRLVFRVYSGLKMCSLSLFPPPLPIGQTTVCESNNELLSRSTYEDQVQQVGLRNTVTAGVVRGEATAAGNEISGLCTQYAVAHGRAMSILVFKKERKKQSTMTPVIGFAVCACAVCFCRNPVHSTCISLESL